MADIFRLLLRGTPLAKGASGGSNIPSRSPQPAPASSKKRKSTPDSSSDAIPEELDFFGMGAGRKKQKLITSEDDGDVSDVSMAGGSGEVTEDTGVEKALEGKAAIRKTLWEHKLKFTILSGTPTGTEQPIGDGSKNKEGEKKEKNKGEKKKKQLILIPPLTSFSQLRSQQHGYSLSKRVYENILAQGYTQPTEVQMGALPVLVKKDCVSGLIPGEVDLLTCAPTGSGKTLAYVVPLLDGILAARKQSGEERGIKAIILAPTKELAGQIVNEIKKLSVGTGVRVSLMRKGMAAASTKGEDAVIHVKSDILVSTPLLLLHAIESVEKGEVFGKVRRLVLDEADVLLDELFRDQTLGIWKSLQETVGRELRTSLWSATISSSTEEIARNMMHPSLSSPSKPKTLPQTPHTILRLIVGIKDTALPTISQTLTYTATESGKLLALRQLFITRFHPPALLFVQSISRAQALYNEVMYDLATPGRIAVLHASLTDTAREGVMDRFRCGDIWVLITTDLLARGVDFAGVRLVVNYDIPTTVVAYIHRIGRTGRVGREGCEAITYYTKEDIGYVKGIANVIATSQKMGGVRGGVEKWLLDALPKTSRKERKELKRRGVKARAVVEGAKGRISTKSGYERQREDRKRGAVEASKRRKLAKEGAEVDEDEDEDEDEFMGIED